MTTIFNTFNSNINPKMLGIIGDLGMLYGEFSLNELKIGLTTLIKLHKDYGFTKTDVTNLVFYFLFGYKE